MSAPKWHQGHLLAFDTETSGVDPTSDRIVTAAIVHMAPGQRPRPITFVMDPEVEIPAEAAAVHGWTNERLAQHLRPGEALRTANGHTQRMSREGALAEIVGQLGTGIHAQAALVVHNAAFDLTLIETEAERHGIDPLTARPDGIRGVVDPMVIEKQFDPYRKVCQRAAGCDRESGHHECGGCRGGKHKCGGCGALDRKLESLCRHYGVVHAGAHDASADAVAAARLAGKLVAAWPQIASWKLATLHEHQVTWKRDQSASLASWWRKQGDPRAAEVDLGWPLQTRRTAGVAA